MKFRNTAILLLIVVALGAYVLLVERKAPPPEDKNATPTAAPLPQMLTFAAADVRALRLARPAQNQLSEFVYQDDSQWHITAPTQEEADPDQVTRLIDSLSTLQPSRVLTGEIGALTDYELDPPDLQVEIEMRDGTIYRLLLGATTPAHSAYYAQVSGDERIYLIPIYIGSDVERYLTTPPVKPTPTTEPTSTSTAGG